MHDPRPFTVLSRRQACQAAAVGLAGFFLPARSQAGKGAKAPAQVTIAQIVDTSGSQQDVSKDFLIGSRAAWQEINAKGGLQGRAVSQVSVETDGTQASIKTALTVLLANPGCVVLSGTVGDPTASAVAALLQAEQVEIAHAAPWLQNSSLEVDDRTFPIFAQRQEQIGHALKSLNVMGVRQLGAVFASARERSLYQQDLARVATANNLQLISFVGQGDLSQLGQHLTQDTPAILLFLGGTPELMQLTTGLDRQARQRFIIALAEVNLQTIQQMGSARATAIVATQPVPMVSAGIPVVRSYRETMAKLFDEPLAALSLAGYIAAKYTFQILNNIPGPITRASALAAFRRREPIDVGGFQVRSDSNRQRPTFVTQTLLTTDGRVVG